MTCSFHTTTIPSKQVLQMSSFWGKNSASNLGDMRYCSPISMKAEASQAELLLSFMLQFLGSADLACSQITQIVMLLWRSSEVNSDQQLAPRCSAMMWCSWHFYWFSVNSLAQQSWIHLSCRDVEQKMVAQVLDAPAGWWYPTVPGAAAAYSIHGLLPIYPPELKVSHLKSLP